MRAVLLHISRILADVYNILCHILRDNRRLTDTGVGFLDSVRHLIDGV